MGTLLKQWGCLILEQINGRSVILLSHIKLVPFSSLYQLFTISFCSEVFRNDISLDLSIPHTLRLIEYISII